MRTRFSLLVLTAALLMVAVRGSFAQDPMAQWKPSVGDTFVYADTSVNSIDWHGVPTYTETNIDTLTMEILNIDSAYSDTYQHVVTVRNSLSRTKYSYENFYYFHPGHNGLSPHPFAIDVSSQFCDGCPVNSSDFSMATDARVIFQSDTLDLYVSSHDSDSGDPNAVHWILSKYSKKLRWLYSRSSVSSDRQDQNYYNTSYGMITLIAATVRSAVEQHPTEEHSPMSLEQSDHFLTLTLHEETGGPFTIFLRDPLARTIRHWQLQPDDARREITLNIADLPSGIYFLMLEAPKKTEVRKLAIVR